MDTNQAIIVTGAAGFIGSCMVQYLNGEGFNNVIMVDDFGNTQKEQNWVTKKYSHLIDRADLVQFLKQYSSTIGCFIHLGARTDTAEFNYAIHQKLNIKYSQVVWQYCTTNQIPMIYASSAATYGAGDLGYNDDHDIVTLLKPLNPYGVSKNEFDKWALSQTAQPPFWTGLKFFNVYGPNENHKGRMASVIWHSFKQIKDTGLVRLFKSYRDDFEDGQQLRDFVYVKDLLMVMFWMMVNMADCKWQTSNNGLYNLGTGNARSFYDLVIATFKGVDRQPDVEFIDMPEDIRDKYQYFTEANMLKLREAGYKTPFYSLENGVEDYVNNYLIKNQNY